MTYLANNHKHEKNQKYRTQISYSVGKQSFFECSGNRKSKISYVAYQYGNEQQIKTCILILDKAALTYQQY